MILSNMACSVTAAGISRPSFSDIYETLQAKFKSIYGSDAYILPDSQDGQMLAVVAKAIDDCNAACQAAYSAFSPATAQGAALSNNVKLNGIARAVATHSTVDLFLVGTVGTQINGGVVSDTSGNRWLLPTTVTIPIAGSITVTATSEEAGAIQVSTGTVTKIETPTLGWTSSTNPSASAPGAPVETDAALRQRQTVSVTQPSRTVLGGILGAVLALPGVTAARAYENDTSAVDANAQPAKSIALVVKGGVNADIASAILMKKTPGCLTHGTTTAAVSDTMGVGPYNINFFRPTNVPILVAITIKARPGYATAIGTAIKQAIVDYINLLGIGVRVDLGKLYLPAQFFGAPDSAKFEVDVLQIAASPGPVASADVSIPYTSIATCQVSDVTLTVVP
jgi:uncharacterized phage protein gp47/JayE